ncbi:MAG: DUF4426 domain-containing protein [Shewanella sp.]
MLRNLLAVLALTASLCGAASAEQKETVGNFDIHYMALASTFLTPSIAKSYGIQRSSYTGIINIAVLDISETNKPAVPVVITGVANNLLDARINLTFKEIREGDAIYYIAEVPFRDDQEINFNIAIKYGNRLNTNLKFKQKFYVD